MSPTLIYLLIDIKTANSTDQIKGSVIQCNLILLSVLEEVFLDYQSNKKNVIYYIQPIPMYSNQVIYLKKGFLNGINWMIRSIDSKDLT